MTQLLKQSPRTIAWLVAALLGSALPSMASGNPFQAGTTWPVLHADAQNRDTVALAGARELVPTWRALQVKANSSVVTIGPEGNLYTITMDDGACHLHALDAEGNELWCSDQVRAAFSYPAVAADGSIYVTDGVEVFRFDPHGTILWRVPATGISLGFVFSPEDYPIAFDSLGLATAYDPATGSVVAQLEVPAGVIPRPVPLPRNLSFFRAGGPQIGIAPDFVDTFIDLFADYETAIGNNIPAVHPETGRLFIAVSADETVTEGVFYGIDFEAPTGTSPGSFSIACQATVGFASGTSPAISRDGRRVYAGDSSGLLTAFDVDDCSPVWTLALESPSLASPTVGEDGRFYMLVGGKVVGFQDDGTSAEVLFETSAGLGGLSGTFNSVLALTSNYLYGAATLSAAVGAQSIPVLHSLVSIDPQNGQIVALGELGEESDSTLSVAADGSVYVPSKPLAKGVLLGIPPLAPLVPPAQSGVFAFEPASFAELSFDGVVAARSMADSALGALEDDVDAAQGALRQAVRQTGVVNQNLERAEEREEIDDRERRRVGARVHLAHAAFRQAERIPIPSRPRLAKLAVRAKRALTRNGGEQLRRAEEMLAVYQRGNGTLVQDATLEHEGQTRFFDYYVPADLPEGPVPLLMVLHGGTVDAKATALAETAEFRDIADREKLIVVYPNGTSAATGETGPSGSFNWNDCRSDAGAAGTEADDVGFVDALIEWADAAFAIDPQRVFATGVSNGGLMSSRSSYSRASMCAGFVSRRKPWGAAAPCWTADGRAAQGRGLSLPPADSTKQFCTGLPDWMKCSLMPRAYAQLSSARLVSSRPSPTTITEGFSPALDQLAEHPDDALACDRFRLVHRQSFRAEVVDGQAETSPALDGSPSVQIAPRASARSRRLCSSGETARARRALVPCGSDRDRAVLVGARGRQ